MAKLLRWQFNLFYLILFLIPSNLAKHFILPSSYVSGILVDYLIPTVYLTDVLIILLLILWTVNKINGREFRYLSVFLLLLLPSVIFADSFVPAVYKWLKFLEMTLLAAWIKDRYKQINWQTVIKVLSFSVLFQSVLALGQWLKQSSVFGFWFLGEQPYNTATAGVDKIVWFDGSLKIPPLGTTPHPNVLAGFLVVTLPLILTSLQGRTLKVVTLILAGLALFLTASLSAWLAFLLIALPGLIITFTQTKRLRIKKLLIYFGGALIFLSLLAGQLSFLAPQSSFDRRSQLTQIALKMIKDKPLTGVGLNNFTVAMDQYGFVTTATTRFFQPVHNIYLLILSETGLIGLLGFLYLFLQGLSLKAFKESPYWILLFLGLFDHWPLTLQPGLLLLTILLACNKKG